MPTLHAATLLDFAARLFAAAGVPDADASCVAQNLVGANLRGHDSHGVLRIPQYIDFLRKGDYQIDVDLQIENESAGVVVVDGQWGLGQVQAHKLLDLVIAKAKALGLACGTGRNIGHIGRLGEYAERAAEEGLILIATVNNGGAGQRVAPPGGIAPRIGTNPLCVGVPTDENPVVLDFGTSVAAEGKVRVHYFNNKQSVPEGWLLDATGYPDDRPVGPLRASAGIDPADGWKPGLQGIRPRPGAGHARGRSVGG